MGVYNSFMQPGAFECFAPSAPIAGPIQRNEVSQSGTRVGLLGWYRGALRRRLRTMH
jgi:hypothetical protein